MVKRAASMNESTEQTYYNPIISWMVERLYMKDFAFELFGLDST